MEVLGLPFEALEDPLLGERHRGGLVVGGELAELLVGHQGEAQLVDLRAAEPAAGPCGLGVALWGERGEVGLQLLVGPVVLLLLALGAMAPGVGGVVCRLDSRSATSCEKHIARVTN